MQFLSSYSLKLGIKVYGFMSVAEDATCGVCAHEIGHLGKLRHQSQLSTRPDSSSFWLA